VETWTLKVNSINRLEAFEMWILRRMLLLWMQKMILAVLLRAGVKTILFETGKRKEVEYLSHILRSSQHELLRLVLEGKIKGIGRKKSCRHG